MRSSLRYIARASCAIILLATLAGCSSRQVSDTPPPDSDGDGIYDRFDQCPTLSAGGAIGTQGCPGDSDGDGVPDYLDECPDTPPGAAACAFGCENGDPIVINLVNDEFDFDKSDLKPDMIVALDEVIRQIQGRDDVADLTVVGHTDNIGTEEYNVALSLRRAQSVVDYLSSNGLGHVKFIQHGKGETQPIADNGTAEGRALNRRVEIFTHSVDEHCCSLRGGHSGDSIAHEATRLRPVAQEWNGS